MALGYVHESAACVHFPPCSVSSVIDIVIEILMAVLHISLFENSKYYPSKRMCILNTSVAITSSLTKYLLHHVIHMRSTLLALMCISRMEIMSQYSQQSTLNSTWSLKHAQNLSSHQNLHSLKVITSPDA